MGFEYEYKVKNLFPTDNVSNNSSSTSTSTYVDPKMSMNGSLFGSNAMKCYSGSASASLTSSTSSIESTTGKSREQLLSDGSKAESDGNSGSTSAKGATAECDQLSTQAEANNAQDKTKAQQVKTQANAGASKIRSNVNKVNQKTQENDKLNQDIQDLQQQIAELSGNDGTGIGAKSAFSLKFDDSKPQTANNQQNAGNAKNKTQQTKQQNAPATQEKSDNTNNGNDEKIQDLQNQVDDKTAKIQVNTTTISAAQSTTSATTKMLTNLFTQAKQFAAKTTTASTEGLNQASAAQKIGQTTQLAGSALTTSGGVLSLFGKSEVAAPDPTGVTKAKGFADLTFSQKLTAVGSLTSAAGTAAVTASNAANGNLTQAVQSAGQLTSTIQNAQQTVKSAGGDVKTDDKNAQNTQQNQNQDDTKKKA